LGKPEHSMQTIELLCTDSVKATLYSTTVNIFKFVMLFSDFSPDNGFKIKMF